MDDREYILSQLEERFPDWKERNLSQFNLEPDGFGLGEQIHRLYDDIHAFNQKEWGPEEAAEWETDPPIVYPDSSLSNSFQKKFVGKSKLCLIIT